LFLLDSGIWIAAGTPGHRWHTESAALVRNPIGPLSALDLTLYEVANVVGAHGGDPASARTLTKLLRRRCGEHLVAADLELIDAALDLAAQYGLSAYDAAYVAAARRSNSQLVSIDVHDLVSKGLAVTPDAALYP
jgi:predicted nucleic acid-binding protein